MVYTFAVRGVFVWGLVRRCREPLTLCSKKYLTKTRISTNIPSLETGGRWSTRVTALPPDGQLADGAVPSLVTLTLEGGMDRALVAVPGIMRFGGRSYS